MARVLALGLPKAEMAEMGSGRLAKWAPVLFLRYSAAARSGAGADGVPQHALAVTLLALTRLRLASFASSPPINPKLGNTRAQGSAEGCMQRCRGNCSSVGPPPKGPPPKGPPPPLAHLHHSTLHHDSRGLKQPPPMNLHPSTSTFFCFPAGSSSLASLPLTPLALRPRRLGPSLSPSLPDLVVVTVCQTD